ncbi:bis(5'-nucleosyl)-tetraphosphatase (symmetrical) YqeK [Tengunoibacter tsumagoiensis]|uniref:HDIG domain-containing protein n=1 Tax=Tengunoibacter tsumagoiensis TaxID=2014871 RepID=A0A401ZYQ0_9CHLR|nr:bis(5'-nucleosyl)-tetraphosphatase (symmetrical) YqeK [Tengunoibacter tsumagoiensis]GCE11971.1 HDIG domain-containing protein [Tengunoibacter tsumagoiensis]
MPERPIAPSHEILAHLLGDLQLTGNLSQDVPAFLHQHHHPATALHCQQVAAMARHVATSASVDLVQAEIAGWLHDVSAIIPPKERVHIARSLGLEVFAEEDRCPMIVHQKLSRLMAQEIFGVRNVLILDAIGCHTTLRPKPTALDKVLFVADKLAWDQPGIPPYAHDLQAALTQSLDQATSFFLSYLWSRRDTLLVIHPWLQAAVYDLCGSDSK